MKLYIMRHGEARAAHHDPERGLTELGQADCLRMAAFLASQQVSVQAAAHSHKLRARQTAEIITRKIAPTLKLGVREDLMPESSAMQLAKYCYALDQDTLLVSHLPLVAYVVMNLLNIDQQQCPINFQPATMVCLERVDHYTWQLDWILSADLFRP